MKKTYIIAEAGVNHNGSEKKAHKLIDLASDIGVDAIKFQTFKAEEITTVNAPKANYQLRETNNNESQLEMLKKLEFDLETHKSLIDHCREKNIHFLSTPFDLASVDMLANKLHLPVLKIGSGEINNAPLLLKAAQTKKKLILSTGMSSLTDIETALGVIAFGYINQNNQPSLKAFQDAYFSKKGQEYLNSNLTLLHCTSEYPTPFQDVNLRILSTLKSAFGLPVGYSDHTPGIAISIAAVSLGAGLIEKHFTLDRSLPGPDHKSSLEPKEFDAMVGSIRQVEEAIGLSIKIPPYSELKNKDIVRKSLVAKNKINKGEKFSENNLVTKRPGTGISPIYYWDTLGEIAKKDYEEDDLI